MDGARYIYLAHSVMVAVEQHQKTSLKLSTETKKIRPGYPKKVPQQILQNQNSETLRSKEQKS